MSAKAICNVCSTETAMETTPMGVAMMPPTWFVCVVPKGDDLAVIDVCSQACAEAFDKSQGRNETVINGLGEQGEITEQIIEHKAAD